MMSLQKNDFEIPFLHLLNYNYDDSKGNFDIKL